MTAGSARALLDPASGEPERRARKLLPEARGPREVRSRLEDEAALIELARLAVGLAEAEQQLAVCRRVGRLGEGQRVERAVEVADGLLVCQCGERAAGRTGRVVDGLRRCSAARRPR